MTSPYKGKPGLKRVWKALFYSLDGFAAAFKYEDSFRLQVRSFCSAAPAR